MTETLKKRLKIAVPEGIAVFPKLDQPDFHEQYHKDGAFMTDVAITKEEAEALSAKLTEFGQAWLKKKQQEGENITSETRFKLPIKPQLDKDKNPTGKMLVRTKMNFKVQLSKDSEPVEQRPLIIGLNGNPIEPVPQIGGGSIIRVGADAVCTYVVPSDTFYVSLRLRAVQVVELKTFGQVTESDYDDYGFAVVEEEATVGSLETEQGDF